MISSAGQQWEFGIFISNAPDLVDNMAILTLASDSILAKNTIGLPILSLLLGL